MVNICAVFGCGNKVGKPGVSFYRFPVVNLRFNEEIQKLQRKRRATWISALKREDLTEKKCEHTRICSQHFNAGAPASLYQPDHPDWSPTVNLGYKKSSIRSIGVTMGRHERAARRQRKQISSYLEQTPVRELPTEEIDAEAARINPCDVATQVDFGKISVAVQTDLTVNYMNCAEDEQRAANEERYKLREQVESLKLGQKSFECSDAKVTFYTGLTNYALLLSLLEFVSPFLSATATSSLCKFQQLLVTLMKLRLDLTYTDLAYRFNVSISTISRVFHNTLELLDFRLQGLIIWPDREILQKTMPLCFQQKFGKSVVVIIDCFEIFTERPSNIKARCDSWSTYKHHHTIKYLIGITPQGSVSFISDGWGGRTSDKHITEECGFLNKLLPGDTILADRGFNIVDEVGLYYATVNIPAFTKGKNQLDPKDVEETRKIASVRIHVERVIGTIRKKYKILSGTIPIDMLSNKGAGSALDSIVRVSCALVNMCPSVVPFE